MCMHTSSTSIIIQGGGGVAIPGIGSGLGSPADWIGLFLSLSLDKSAHASYLWFISRFPTFVLQISCSSASEELSNRTRFRNYFQLLPTDADLAFGFFGIITRFKWKHIAIILQEERLFQAVSAPNGHLSSLTVVSSASAGSGHVATTFQGVNVPASVASNVCYIPGIRA